MEKRVSLQNLLETLLASRNVYFQPPANVQLKYPCIVYKREGIETIFADNKPYDTIVKYKVTAMDYDPDSEIVRRLSLLPMCRFDTHYTVNNLNHDVFILYY